jgi:hypothetical protein
MTDEAPMMNAPEARTATGEIQDQATTSTTTENPTTSETSAPAAAPEKYEFKAPEGQTYDQATIDAATPLFKELGLSQEAAQKLVDFHASQTAKINTDLASAVDTMRAQWRESVMKDPAIGPKLDSVKVELGRAKDRLPTEVRTAFDTALNETGLGDHPAVVRALYEFSKMVNEGSHVSGSAPSPLGQSKSGQPSRPSIAGALYPNLPQ